MIRVFMWLLRIVALVLNVLERTPWGAPVIATLIGVGVGIVGWIADQPPLNVFVLAAVAIQAWFYILRWGVPILGRRLAPNLIIEIPESMEAETPSGGRVVAFPIQIVNCSRSHSVSLHFVYVEETIAARFHTRDIGHDLKTNLGPEEETSGNMRVEHSLHSSQARIIKATKQLIVGDRFSQRSTTVTIPGSFRR